MNRRRRRRSLGDRPGLDQGEGPGEGDGGGQLRSARGPAQAQSGGNANDRRFRQERPGQPASDPGHGGKAPTRDNNVQPPKTGIRAAHPPGERFRAWLGPRPTDDLRTESPKIPCPGKTLRPRQAIEAARRDERGDPPRPGAGSRGSLAIQRPLEQGHTPPASFYNTVNNDKDETVQNCFLAIRSVSRNFRNYTGFRQHPRNRDELYNKNVIKNCSVKERLPGRSKHLHYSRDVTL